MRIKVGKKEIGIYFGYSMGDSLQAENSFYLFDNFGWEGECVYRLGRGLSIPRLKLRTSMLKVKLCNQSDDINILDYYSSWKLTY